jgi:hypothetical protein
MRTDTGYQRARRVFGQQPFVGASDYLGKAPSDAQLATFRRPASRVN